MATRRKRRKDTDYKKNNSAIFDVHVTEDDEKEIEKRRNKYAKDFRKFAADNLYVMDRDSPTGAAYVNLKFNHAQAYLDHLITRVGDFQEEMSKAFHLQDPNIPVSRLPVHLVCLKARKVGWSTYIQARAFWKCEHNRGLNCLVMAHDSAGSENIAKISRRFDLEYSDKDLPVRRVIDRSSDKLIEWGIQPNRLDGQQMNWDSRIVVKTAGTKVSGSSRGHTWHMLHVSEEAHFSESDEVATAFAAKVPYYEAFEESTAKGVGGLFYDNWKNAMWLEDVLELWRSGKPFPSWWNRKFRAFWSWLQDPSYKLPVMDWEREEILKTKTEIEQDLLENHGATVEQLKWRRNKISGECSDQKEMEPEMYFMQEYPTTPDEAFVSKGANVFQMKALAKMEARAKNRKPERTCRVHVHSSSDDSLEVAINSVKLADVGVNPELWIWTHPDPSASYIVTCDTAAGLQHGDDTAMTVWNRTDGTRLLEAARLKSKHDPDQAAYILVHLARMYNDAYIIPEANAPGNATCLKVVNLRYPWIFHRENPELITDMANPEAFTAGFKTLVNTKPLLVRAGQEALRNGQIEIFSLEAIEQWQHYQNDNGRYGAPKGEKDDLVMADLLGIWFHFEGKAPPVRQPKKNTDDVPREFLENVEVWKSIKKMIQKARKENKRRRHSVIGRPSF